MISSETFPNNTPISFSELQQKVFCVKILITGDCLEILFCEVLQGLTTDWLGHRAFLSHTVYTQAHEHTRCHLSTAFP